MVAPIHGKNEYIGRDKKLRNLLTDDGLMV